MRVAIMLKKTVICLFAVLIGGCSTSKVPVGQYVMEHDFSDGHIEYWGQKYEITPSAVIAIRAHGSKTSFSYKVKGTFIHLKPEKPHNESIVLEIINKNTLIERINFGKDTSSDNIYIRYKKVETVELSEEKEKNYNL